MKIARWKIELPLYIVGAPVVVAVFQFFVFLLVEMNLWFLAAISGSPNPMRINIWFGATFLGMAFHAAKRVIG